MISSPSRKSDQTPILTSSRAGLRPPLCWPLMPVPDAEGRIRFPTLEDSIRQRIEAVLRTSPGEQLMRPAFGAGLELLVHQPNTAEVRARAQETIRQAIAVYEPRGPSTCRRRPAPIPANCSSHQLSNPRDASAGSPGDSRGSRDADRPPALDDRGFNALVADLGRRIPAHTPEWTDPREGDPGRTLIDLFAWLGDTILYRANLVPERQRLAFLRLLGQQMRPAIAARGLVQVSIGDEAWTQPFTVPARTAIAKPVHFEIESELGSSPSRARPVSSDARTGERQHRRPSARSPAALRSSRTASATSPPPSS